MPRDFIVQNRKDRTRRRKKNKKKECVYSNFKKDKWWGGK